MEKHFCLDDSPTFRMIELDEVDSTNNFLRHLATPGDCRTTLVTAEYQSAGRGADTNRWESARGENLLFSLRVMPRHLPARRMFAISEAAALAVRESLSEAGPSLCPSLVGRGVYSLPVVSSPLPTREEQGEGPGAASCRSFTVKWPNDIYFGDSKVAGILIENDLQGALVVRSTIGIGININQRRFLSDAPNPRSLADIVGHDVERRFVLERFMDCFTHLMKPLDEGMDCNDAALDALHESYKKHLYRLGEKHKFADEMGVFCAILTDVEPSGHLILLDEEGRRRRYAFKEVKYLL